MVSKEEFLRDIKVLMSKQNFNYDVKYLSNKYKSVSGTLLTLGTISLLIGFNYFGLLFTILLVPIGIICFIISIIRIIKSDKAKKYYRDNYREKVIEYLLKDSDYKFNENDYIEKQIFNDSQFGDRYEDYRGSDKLTINIPNDDGSKSNNYLTLCDLDVTKTETDSDGDSRTVTVYQGVFGYIYFPFNFKCALSLNAKHHRRGLKLQKVTLEDISFNKKFKTYSDNQIEARYILTPSMMEKLLCLNSKLGRIKVSLIDNKMYLGFSRLDLFELKSIKDDKSETLFENFYDEIDVILKIVEEIKNNNKVFKI